MTASSKSLLPAQIDKLADVFVGLTHVSLGLSVIPGILDPEQASIIVTSTGVVMGLVFVIISLGLAKSL